MRITIPIVLFLLSHSLAGQSILFKDYFPLNEGDKQVYRLYQISKYGKRLMQDSLVNICQSKVINKTTVYYFRRDAFPDDTVFAWGIPMFCYSFFFKNDSLMSLPTMFKSELEKTSLDSFIVDIPKVIQLGRRYKHMTKEMNQVYIFNRIENIKIGKKVLKNCLKLTAYSYNKYYRYKREYWFKKGFGFVKYFAKGEISDIWEIRL